MVLAAYDILLLVPHALQFISTCPHQVPRYTHQIDSSFVFIGTNCNNIFLKYLGMPPKTPAPRLTHFLCIPLVTATSRPQLQKSLQEFRQAVTNKSTPENPDGIPTRAVRLTGTLHLTLGVMSLLNAERVDAAITCLKSIDLITMVRESFHGKDQLDPALSITLRGLASMHDPGSTSVLYSSPVDEDGSLQAFCQGLRNKFLEEGLMIEERRPLLLHATLLNTVYVPGIKAQGAKSRHAGRRARITIDARMLIDDWRGTEWMKVESAESVAICKMGAKKVENEFGEEDEEYEVEGSIAFSRINGVV